MNPETKSKPCPYCTGDPVDFADWQKLADLIDNRR